MEVQFDDEAVESPVDTPEQAPEPSVSEETPEASATPPAEEAPAEKPSEAPEPVAFTPEQQAFINDNIVAKQVAKRGQAEREAEELRAQLKELQEANKPPEEDPEPQIPEDMWADDYEQRKAQFKQDHAAWAQRQYEREASERQEQALEQQRQQAEQQAQYERVLTYTERAETLGITREALQVAGNTVEQMGVQPEIANYLLADEHGPAVTMYLAKNLQEVQAMQNMDPISAGIYIATEIKPKVSRKLKRDNPPEPVETVSGASVPEKERGPKGAVYE